MTNVVYEIVKVMGLGFKECMYEYYSLGLLYYNKEEAQNNAKILWEKETTDEERNSRWCAIHFVVKERQIIGSLEPEIVPEDSEVNSSRLKRLADWLRSDEGKKAIKDGLEKTSKIEKIIKSMNDIDLKILRQPFSVQNMKHTTHTSEYTLTIMELIQRPVIRNDNPYEFLNKMTDEEIEQWDKEVIQILKEEKVPEIFPDYNAAYLAKMIDRQILYDLFVLGNNTVAISTKD